MVKADTTVSIACSANPSIVGQPVQLTATVSAAATGTVQFLDGATLIGTTNVANGTAVLTTSTLAGGSHSIKGVYSGDANYGSSTSAVMTVSVGKANTTVAVNSSLNPTAAGQSVTFSATVSPALATGSMQFLDGATVLGVVAISGGEARLTTAALGVGSRTITVVYSGDGSYNGASSGLLQTVTSATSVSLSAPNRSVTFGQTVQLTASLSPSIPTGTVQFLDGAVVLATVAVSGGTASLSVSTLTAGTHSLRAVYNGDSNVGAGTSPVLTIIVSKANSSVSLSPSQNPSMSGVSVTFTATVFPASAAGSVQFLDGTTVFGTVDLRGGVAVLSIPNLAAGNHTMTAAYAGDASLNPSTSPVVTELVSVQTPVLRVNLRLSPRRRLKSI